MVKLKYNYEGIFGEPCIGNISGTCEVNGHYAENTLGEYVLLDSEKYGLPKEKKVYLIENNNLLATMYPKDYDAIYDKIYNGDLDMSLMTMFLAEKQWTHNFIVTPDMSLFLKNIDLANAIIFHECGHILNEKDSNTDAEVLADLHACKNGYAENILFLIQRGIPVLFELFDTGLAGKIEYRARVREINKFMKELKGGN